MSKIFVTSDLHFDHENIIKYDNRPFEDLHSMNDALICNWNNVVGDDDTVYILGDFALTTPERATLFLKMLNGKKILVRGNHDLFVDKKGFDKRLFEEITYYKEIKYNKKKIVMCHYPIAVWNGKHYGHIHLFGHIHSNIYTDHPLEKIEPNSYNVSADANHYAPILLDNIIELMHKLRSPEEHIPKDTPYCYNDNGDCPFWESRENTGSQNYGYCHYLGMGDYERNKKSNNSDDKCWLGRDDSGELVPLEGTTTELFGEQFPHSLLWDQCKECGINDDWDFEEEENEESKDEKV